MRDYSDVFSPYNEFSDEYKTRVENMTPEEAIWILSKHARTDGDEWSPRPHMAKACELAVNALRECMMR